MRRARRPTFNAEKRKFVDSFETLVRKARWVRGETLKLHKRAPETRLASSLSAVEIFVVLYYGGILRFDAENPFWNDRDRFIISKGHGAISLYPILADLNFFAAAELVNIARKGSFLGVIPDAAIPGFETTNGSLGHGLGVSCGVARALKAKKQEQKVFVLSGDGELNEGSCWEAIMFAAHHHLDNLILIIDDNKMSMLGYQKDICSLEPLAGKFAAFGWDAVSVDGHNVEKLHSALHSFKINKSNQPKVVVANTKKAKGVPVLETDPLCHIKSLKAEEVDELVESFV